MSKEEEGSLEAEEDDNLFEGSNDHKIQSKKGSREAKQRRIQASKENKDLQMYCH